MGNRIICDSDSGTVEVFQLCRTGVHFGGPLFICLLIYTAARSKEEPHMSNIVCKCTVNLNNVDKKLLDVEPKIARKLLRKALTNVGKFWVPAVQSRVPVLEGDLKQSIHAVVRTRKASEKTAGLPTGSVKVGPCYGTPRSDGRHSFVPAIYGMWVEFGVRFQREVHRAALS